LLLKKGQANLKLNSIKARQQVVFPTIRQTKFENIGACAEFPAFEFADLNNFKLSLDVPQRLFFAAQQRKANTWKPK
jgi:hypothetical protein